MPKCSKCGKSITSATMVCDECMPRWIPAEERLPKKAVPVLVRHIFERYEEISIGCYTKDGYWEWFAYFVKGGFIKKAVGGSICPGSEFLTHWMPLPEPPKEVQK